MSQDDRYGGSGGSVDETGIEWLEDAGQMPRRVIRLGGQIYQPPEGQDSPPLQEQGDRSAPTEQTQPPEERETKPVQTEQPQPPEERETKSAQTEQTQPPEERETKPAQAEQTRPPEERETKPVQAAQTQPPEERETKPAQTEQTQPPEEQRARPVKGQETRPPEERRDQPSPAGQAARSAQGRPAQGQNTQPPQGPVYYPPQGPWYCPPQGQGYYPPQGPGYCPLYYPPQGQGFYPPQGQGYYPQQGQGYYPPQGQGYYPQGPWYYPPQGQGYYPQQGPWYYPPQGQNAQPPQGQGTRPQQSQGAQSPQGQGTRPQQGQSARPTQGQGTRPQQGQSARPPQGQGTRPPQGQDGQAQSDQGGGAPQSQSRPKRQEVEDWVFRAQAAQIRRARQENDYPWEEEPEEPPRSRMGGLSLPVILLIVLLVIGMGIAAWQLISIFSSYERDRSAYEDLAGQAIQVLAEPVVAEPGGETAQEDGQTQEEEPFVSEVPISVDWDYLRSINSDIVGWLYCPNTVINYPVVQTSDNSYYLKHGFDGKSNAAGTLFSDMSSASDVTLSNLIIYGHNMKDGSMFHSLMGYVNENYYHDYPTMYYITPEASYRVDLICAHIVESTLDNFPTFFSTKAEYQTYLNTITSRSFWVNYEALQSATDYQLLTLSTCSYTSGYADPRLLVHGLLVPVR